VKANLNCRRLAAACALLLAVAAPGGRGAAASSPLTRIDFGQGDRELARTGVAAAVVAETLDSLPLLHDPDARVFVEDAFDQLALAAKTEALRAKVESVRANFRSRGARFDRAPVLAAYVSLVQGIVNAMTPVHRRIFLAGELAESIEYNARVLREADADHFRATLARIADADASTPGLADLRAQLGKLESEDWFQSAALSRRAVAAIVGDPATVPFPPAPRIWTIVVRSRVPAGRDAAHLAVDVVWFDGQHQTFAAQPAGGDFSKNADTLTCVKNKEPAMGWTHATPLNLSVDASVDAIASSFERSCDAFNLHPPPYVVADAGDDRFVAALLTAAGLNPKHAMGASK